MQFISAAKGDMCSTQIQMLLNRLCRRQGPVGIHSRRGQLLAFLRLQKDVGLIKGDAHSAIYPPAAAGQICQGEMKPGRSLDDHPLPLPKAVIGKGLLYGDKRPALSYDFIASAEHDLAGKYSESPAVLISCRDK